MENEEWIHIRPGMGPLPAVRRAAPRPMSPSREAVLAAVRRSPDPVDMTALAEETRRHANTVRGHLAALGRAGLVRRRRRSPTGRGRPAWLYSPADPSGVVGATEYGGLAAALASALSATADAPREVAAAAGREWGVELARAQADPGSGRRPRERVIAMLGGFGFAPRPSREDDTVRLTRCPLLETARACPDVVCAVHLGIVQGALGEFGGSGAGVELRPFVEPGACCLDLPR